MRKYFQITFFLGIFAVLVLIRQFKGTNAVGTIGTNQNNTPTSNGSSLSPLVSSIPQQSNNQGSSSSQASGVYKNGTYTGSVQDAFYGNLQVQAVISGGKISDVVFLQYPNDNRTSIFVNSQAMPLLKQEAIQAQSANVDIVSGASQSSQAFRQSLADALTLAK